MEIANCCTQHSFKGFKIFPPDKSWCYCFFMNSTCNTPCFNAEVQLSVHITIYLIVIVNDPNPLWKLKIFCAAYHCTLRNFRYLLFLSAQMFYLSHIIFWVERADFFVDLFYMICNQDGPKMISHLVKHQIVLIVSNCRIEICCRVFYPETINQLQVKLTIAWGKEMERNYQVPILYIWSYRLVRS